MLFLSANNFWPVGLVCLSDALKYNTSITKLNVSKMDNGGTSSIFSFERLSGGTSNCTGIEKGT